jgi:hypothetical protein
MKRRTLIKNIALSIPFLEYFRIGENTLISLSNEDFYKRLVDANTKEVEKIIKNLSKDIEELVRQLGYDYANSVSNVQTLETTITIQEVKNGFEIDFHALGTEGVDVTIELCFKEGGKLSDMKTFESQPNNHFLQNGMGTYTFGKDTITFGNGIYTHNKLRGIDGEVYSTHFGTLHTQGLNVYLTGKTPFRYTLRIGI